MFTQKEQASVPLTSLLVLSNTLLHHPGAKMPLLVFLEGWEGNVNADCEPREANYSGGFCDVEIAR